MKNLRRNLAAWLLLAAAWPLGAQTTAPATTAAPAASSDEEEEVIQLSPFEVQAESQGYSAATTLAGNRLNTELRDIGNAVTVITSQFLADIGATNNESLLQYTVGTEVGNIQGNFAGVGDGSFLDESGRFTNPNQNTRVRGLAQADNTRDYFQTDIPWDGYNVDRVDLQRGPNSILFGQGSPAGIINTGTRQASFRNGNEVSFRFDDQGSARLSLDFNRVLLKDQLAVRISALRDDEQFQQEPAFEKDERLYGAVRFEPGILKRGSARTIIKANFEDGDIDSNRPRSLPPIDLITPWFRTGTYQGTWRSNGTYRDPATGQVVTVTAGAPRTFNNLNRETFNPHQLQDDNTGRANHGQMRPGINGGPDAGRFNPAFNPWIGNFGQQFGGPNAFYSTPGGTPQYWLWEIRTNRGIGANGADDNGIGGFAFHRPGGIADYASFARAAGLPFSNFGVYKNFNLSDDSVFDFYNNLIDGENKREWSDWQAYNISVAQTFMNDKFGFEYVHNYEKYDNGQIALLDGGRQALYIDFMSVYSDGTPDGLNGEPHQNGTPNPNVGRPFISDSGQGGNRSYESSRESNRFTGFLTHDFAKNSDNVLAKFLGRHTFTGLYSKDEQVTDRRDWVRYSVVNSQYRDIAEFTGVKFNDNFLSVNRVLYLGPSLLSRSTAAGANIPRPDGVANAPSGTIRFFDSTWANRPGVDPAAPWTNNYYPVGDTRRNSVQAENPANYIGWINQPIEIMDSEASMANRAHLTTSARLNLNENEAKAFVWQAHLWNNALVATWGYREDTPYAVERRVTSQDNNVAGMLGHIDSFLNKNEYNLTNRTPATGAGRYSEAIFDTVESKALSAVAHLDQLPFIGRFTEKLPVAVTLFYADSTNFQPAANRRDVYGELISLPKGETQEKGILIESRNGKWSFKVNKYKTELTDASSGALGGAWFIGSSQAWASHWTNIFEFNLSGDTGSTANGPSSGRYTYSPAPGETQAQADAREAAAIAAWRTWQNTAIAKKMYAAWNIDPTGGGLTRSVSATMPAGFTVTEDSTSEGYEFEFSAQPTRNWRVTFNASKTEARRQNIGGANLSEFISAYENFLKTTAGGDLRIWWGGAGNETTLFQWNNNIGSEYAARKLQEGTNVPELREWRFNVVSNYDFSEGRLRGVNVGAAVRWQDSVVIGYTPVPVPNDPSSVSFDLANPYMGPSETNVDLWIGYGRKLRDNIDWRIQLNVRNVGEGDGLIPITTQPDGTPAGYRLAPRQAWTITNTFKF
ncbi:MAG TPA: TonB-dependent receptor plug domain-containing protein [Opitutaceae bacterium]|nr:TonB-dependent receptor plug domain-containing protein [Opitutaceae bacterium]